MMEYEDEVTDTIAEDAADYFATIVKEKFPDVSLEALDVPHWRKGWRIIMPPQFTQKKELLELIMALRDMLFWQKDILLAYELVEQE